MNVQTIASVLLLLVKLAEIIITGTKAGAERKEKVISWFYELLPDGIITREKLDSMIEDAVSAMKNELEEAAK